MYYIEDKGIILAYLKELYESEKYEEIRKLIESNIYISKVLDNPIIIFEIFERYEDGPRRCDEDDCVYDEILCICNIEVMNDNGTTHTVYSDISHTEQIKNILMECADLDYTLSENPEEINVPYVICDGQATNYALVPVVVDQYIGRAEEFDENLEYIEE